MFILFRNKLIIFIVFMKYVILYFFIDIVRFSAKDVNLELLWIWFG